jgi:hypothetical protein
MSLIEKFVVALFVVFLHYVGPIGVRADRKNRYHLGWSKKDAAAIVLGMLLLTAALLGMDLLVSWSNAALLRRLFNHLFLVGFVSGWLAAFARGPLGGRPNIAHLIWIFAAAAIGYSFASPDMPLVHYAALCCLVLSPLVPLVVLPMFGWETWSSEPEPKPIPSPKASEGTPVFFVIFDEWSLARSTVDGEFHPQLKNLRDLCRQAVVFPHATSPFGATWQSLPAILYQTDMEYTFNNGKLQFQGREGAVPAQAMRSLFALGRKYRYTSYLLGWFHAYRQLLGDQVDYCHVYREKPLNTGLVGKTIYAMFETAVYLSDPFSNTLWHRFELPFTCRQWFETANRYRSEMLQILAEAPPRTVAFFHTLWPHAPYVFAVNGSYFGATVNRTNVPDYLRQIAYVDHLVGEMVATLRTAGKFDQALLIITSDHGWRDDPDQTFRSLPKSERSVPLLIKLPGQRSGQVIEEEFCNNQLALLLEAVFRGQTDSEELVQLLQRLAAGRPAPVCA